MNRRQSRLLLVCALIVVPSQLALAAPVQWSQNGHWYEVVVVPAPGPTWHEAEAVAEAKGGYLATITSAAENQFVYDLTVNTPGAWENSAEWAIGPYLGGYQDRSAPDYSEPSGGWRWVTGEPWRYTAWLQQPHSQPDNWLDLEDYLFYWGYPNQIMPTWNDGGDVPSTRYVIEYDSSLKIVRWSPPRKEAPGLVAVLANPSSFSQHIQLNAQFFPLGEYPAPPHGQYNWSIVSGADKVKFLGFPLDQKGPRVAVQPIAESTSRSDVEIKVKFTSWTAGVPSCEAYYYMTVAKPTSLRVVAGYPTPPDVSYDDQGRVVGYLVDYAFQVCDQFYEPVPVAGMQVKEEMDVLSWTSRIIFPHQFDTYWTNGGGIWVEQLGTPRPLYRPIPDNYLMEVEQDIYVEGWLVDTRRQTYHHDHATSE